MMYMYAVTKVQTVVRQNVFINKYKYMTYAELVHFNCNFKLAHTTFGYMYNQPSDHRQSLYEAGISNVSPYSSYCIFIQIPIKY